MSVKTEFENEGTSHSAENILIKEEPLEFKETSEVMESKVNTKPGIAEIYIKEESSKPDEMEEEDSDPQLLTSFFSTRKKKFRGYLIPGNGEESEAEMDGDEDIQEPSASFLGDLEDIDDNIQDPDFMLDDSQCSSDEDNQPSSSRKHRRDGELFEYDFGQLSARPRSKKLTDMPSEIGSGGLGKTRKLVQPLAKRPRIPWRKAKEQHHVRPMDFKPKNTGIQVNIPDEFDELAALMLFLPDDLWDTIARESNRYYREKKKAAVKQDITPAEARTYIGIMILLGLNPPHSLRTPWTRNSTFRNDIIASSMTFSRFIHIHDNFHLVDNATLPPPNTTAYKTGRVAPLLHTLKDRCISVYKAKTRQLSLDEGSMGWKGHCSMRQYNPNKPHKYHIKSYKLVETKTGYLSNIILHDTTSRTVDEVVLTLLDESPYNKHEGYAVFTDRFYTSPDLFWHLRTVDGFDATGTCMANRHQFPPELKCAKGKSKKGEVNSYIATHGDANLVAMRWKDAKDVFMLSTEESADMIECDIQCGREKKMKPAMVPLYSKNMGGVDLNDYLESRYSPCCATRKMWKKLAIYLLSTAVTNAYIIFRMVCKDRNRKMPRSPHFAFREALGSIMLTMCDTQPPPNVQPALNPAPIGLGHLPASYPPLLPEAQRAAAEGREPRRPPHRCQMPGCKKKSIFFCQQCNVCLCMRPGRICFSEYHRQMKHRLPDNAKQLAGVPPPPESSTTSDADEPAPQRILPRRSAKRKSAAEPVSQQPSKRRVGGFIKINK